MVAVTLVAEAPVYLIVEVEGTKVPARSKAVPDPAKVTVRFAASKLPALMVRTELTVKSPAAVKVVPNWSKVKLL